MIIDQMELPVLPFVDTANATVWQGDRSARRTDPLDERPSPAKNTWKEISCLTGARKYSTVRVVVVFHWSRCQLLVPRTLRARINPPLPETESPPSQEVARRCNWNLSLSHRKLVRVVNHLSGKWNSATWPMESGSAVASRDEGGSRR